MSRNLRSSKGIAEKFMDEPQRYNNQGTFFGKDKRTGELSYLRIGRGGEPASIRSISKKSSNPEPFRTHFYGGDKNFKTSTKSGRTVLIIKRRR